MRPIFRPSRRDFAFLLDADTDAGLLVRAAAGADRELISNVSVFDEFTGKACRTARSRSPSR